MNHHLAEDRSQLTDLLQQVLSITTGYHDRLASLPPATKFIPQSFSSLPANGLGATETLAVFMQRYGHQMPASNGPRFWGFVTGGTTPAALAGDWLTSAYDLNLSSAANSIAPNIEFEAIHLLRDLFGLPDEFSGTFVTGATMANVAGLALGREWVARQQGINVAEDGLYALPPVPILSGAAHSSIAKALSVLGMGRRTLRPIATLPGTREAVDIVALQTALGQLKGQPCIVVANAGTVNTVDFDDLAAIADLRADFPFWLHVDAAFGGFAACSPRYQLLMAGVAAADSLTIDAHKWLNVPYDAAMIFTRHRPLQMDLFRNSAAYLGEMIEPVDFVHLGPENSRRLRALPAWFTLMAYGRTGYQEIVERCCDLAGQLGQWIDASPAFTLLAPVRMNGVCFTLAQPQTSAEIQAYLDRLRDDGRLFLTPTRFQGRPAIRASLSNWLTQERDLSIAWEAMLDCL